eukprot:76339-Pleurochrysis_carterae.AAC.8
MGSNLTGRHPEITWLLGIASNGSFLPPTHLAFLRMYWRDAYAAMDRVKYDGDDFSPNLIQQNIARTFYCRLLVYQHERSLHFYRRRFSH